MLLCFETSFWETITAEHLISEDTGKFEGMDEFDVRLSAQHTLGMLFFVFFKVRKDRLNVFFKEAPEQRWVPRA